MLIEHCWVTFLPVMDSPSASNVSHGMTPNLILVLMLDSQSSRYCRASTSRLTRPTPALQVRYSNEVMQSSQPSPFEATRAALSAVVTTMTCDGSSLLAYSHAKRCFSPSSSVLHDGLLNTRETSSFRLTGCCAERPAVKSADGTATWRESPGLPVSVSSTHFSTVSMEKWLLMAAQQPVRNDSRMTLVSAKTRIFGIRRSPHNSNGAVRSY